MVFQSMINFKIIKKQKKYGMLSKKVMSLTTQQTFTSSKSTIETLEKDVKYAQS